MEAVKKLETPEVTRKAGGMPEWAFLGVSFSDGKPVFFWPYTSDVNGKRFLTRFIILRTPLASWDVTRISSDDNSRPWPHDHSRSFISWKWGWYKELVYDDPEDLSQVRLREHGRFSFHLLRHSQAHTITEVSPGLVTMLFLGPKRRKSSYWTPEGLKTIGMKVDQDD
jgi:hypothetical protein